MRISKWILILALLAPVAWAQPTGTPLWKGLAEIEDAEIAPGAAIASSKLSSDVVVEADIGAGLEAAAGTISTKSDELGFLADLGAGDLTCGAGTEGEMAVNDADPLQYCDGLATPVRRLAAFGADDGDALAGDTATAFFDAGQIEAARGGTGIDSSGLTGVLRVNSGTWSADAGVSHLASSTSADLLAVLSDETGSGLAVFGTNPTLLDVTVDDLLTFNETAGDATCAAGDYWLKANSTSTTLRGCEDGSLFTLSAGGTNPLSISSPEALTIATGAVTLAGAADTLTYHTIDTEAAASSDDLTTINCTAGSEHVILPADDTRTVVVKAGAGINIRADFSMDNAFDTMVLHCNASNNVRELSRNSGGA